MADGNQRAFNFPRKALVSALRPGEIVVDFFAGGGGASEALRQALGRDPDVAVNHDADALGMHAANHPFTRHMEADVYAVNIVREVAGRPVGWFHASPDCTHFSQAKGGQPRDRATRSLSWVVPKVAGSLARHGLAPRIISLENVRQILGWCPLIAKRDKATGRVLRLDGTVAAPGERVPLREQFLVPDKRRPGETWRKFVAALRTLGYAVEWRLLKACDYGAGTSRERLFLIARRDGEPIRWPAPTHGPGRAHPYVTAAECIDWSIPCPSIFTRKKPLADATLRRIARGVKRYVVDAAEPFIVQANHDQSGGNTGQLRESVASGRMDRRTPACHEVVRGGEIHTQPQRPRTGAGSLCKPNGFVRAGDSATVAAHAVPSAPFLTECANASHAVVAPILAGVGGRAGDTEPRPCNQPGYTVTAKADCALITAFLEQANGGGEHGNPARARGAAEPVSAITATGSQQRLVAAHLAKLRGTSTAADAADPLATVSAGGEHHAVVQCTLSPEHEAGALRVAALLINYYGNGQPRDLRASLDTVTTRDRLALVTVTLHGTPYVIVDIGLRMLKPRELYRAQGFPADYIIDRTASGKPLTISAAVRMVGNSVSPPPLCALARANLDPVQVPERIAA